MLQSSENHNKLKRPSELVLSAIYNLDEDNGSSPQDIVNYIAMYHDNTLEEIKEMVDQTLKQILLFGLISRERKNLYKLAELNELPGMEFLQTVRLKRKIKMEEDGVVGANDVTCQELCGSRNGSSEKCCDRHKKARLSVGGNSREKDKAKGRRGKSKRNRKTKRSKRS